MGESFNVTTFNVLSKPWPQNLADFEENGGSLPVDTAYGQDGPCNLSQVPSLFPEIEEVLGPATDKTDVDEDATRELGMNYEFISNVISSLTTPSIGVAVVSYLKTFSYETTEEPITCCKPFAIYSLHDDYEVWPAVKYRVGEMEVLVLFYPETLDDGNLFLSALTHYGLGKHWTPMGKDWKQSSISWYVRDLNSFRALCVAAQHLMEDVPHADMCTGDAKKLSEEQSSRTEYFPPQNGC